MKAKKIIGALLSLILIISTLSIPVMATVLYEPVEVYLETNKSTYARNEVVEYTIHIGGGIRYLTDTPTYTYTFKDSTGHTYTDSTTDSTISFNKFYTSGKYTATVTVTSNKTPGSASDSVSFTVN